MAASTQNADKQRGDAETIGEGVCQLDTDDRVIFTNTMRRRVDRMKAIRQRLQESGGFYRAMFENNPAAVVLVDPVTWSIVDANPAACQFYGYTRDTMRTLGVADINIQPHANLTDEMARTRIGQRYVFEFTHRVQSGETRDVEVQTGPIKLGGRKLILSVVTDITARKRAAAEIDFHLTLSSLLTSISTRFVAAQQTEFQAHVDQALADIGGFLAVDFVSVCELTPDGGMLVTAGSWCADGIAHLFSLPHGLRVAEFPRWREWLERGEPIRVWSTATLPQDTPLVRHVLEPEGIQAFLAIPMTCGGTVLGYLSCAMLHSTRVWSDDEADAIRSFASIIATALLEQRVAATTRRHEQELRALVDESPDLVVRFDAGLRIVYANSAVSAMNPSPPAVILGQTVRELGVPDDFATLWEQEARQALETGKARTMTVAMPHAGGDASSGEEPARYIEVRIVPVAGSSGTIESILTISRDVTDRERASITIERLNRTLEDRIAERTRQLAAANRKLAHEVAEHERDRTELVAGRARLQNMMRQVVNAQEEERRRISRVLHDEAMQDLIAISMTATWVQGRLPAVAGEDRDRLGVAISLAETSIDRIRRLAHDLRPPSLDTLGLALALEGVCQAYADRAGIPVEYSAAELPALPVAVSVCLYRAVQEGLTNAVKHARAQHIRVRLRSTHEGVVVLVQDDGIGFDATRFEGHGAEGKVSWGAGLPGMRERFEMLDGMLRIRSIPGEGTQLMGLVPWKAVMGA